jgi:hypothetical protein
MTNDEGRKPEGAPERSPKAGEGAPSGVDGNGPKRFSVQCCRWRPESAQRWRSGGMTTSAGAGA